MRVKICGITNKEDALMAVRCGADAIGVIVDVPVDTPRNIDVNRAEAIMNSIPPFISTVAVIMPKSIKDVKNIINELNPDVVQLHGDESLRFVSKIRKMFTGKIIKVIHVAIDEKMDRIEDKIENAKNYAEVVDAIMLDTKIKKTVGGTGKSHNWEISAIIGESINKPLILSGGLNIWNVKNAIKNVGPYAVDVSSGVELEPGKKDETKMREFIKIAKSQ
ncbi:MAG: phosphoribosylanthranilate isomerase [Candidatus Altiarchaeales archaeon]|nr:MAG: phosphoribosylanthranilate isomerase [Candidatus Altiarchaeales archaeon]